MYNLEYVIETNEKEIMGQGYKGFEVKSWPGTKGDLEEYQILIKAIYQLIMLGRLLLDILTI